MTKHLKPKPQPFNFFEALNGQEMLHWTGTPCFISRWISSDPDLVEITTFDGEVIDRISFGALESMDPEDMNFL